MGKKSLTIKKVIFQGGVGHSPLTDNHERLASCFMLVGWEGLEAHQHPDLASGDLPIWGADLRWPTGCENVGIFDSVLGIALGLRKRA